MRVMIWFLGVMVILLGFEVRSSNAWQWAAVWGSSAALWFLIGCVVLVAGLARTAFDKARAGASDVIRRGIGTPPAPKGQA